MKHLFNQTISVYSSSVLDRYGRKTMTTPVDYKARVETKREQYLNTQSAIELADAVMYTDSTCTATIDTRIDYLSEKYIVVKVEKATNKNGSTKFIKFLVKNYK